MSPAEEAIAFLAQEAAMLDDGHYEAWAELFTDDGAYWMPVDRRQKDPGEGVSHIHDDKAMLRARMHRLANPRAFAAEPPPETLHLFGSVEAKEGEGGLTVRSKLIMMEYRERDNFETDTRSFGARVTHMLSCGENGLQIRLKRVDVLGARGSFNALAVPF
jgi:3-phenylpropionate/cinnamic acid dioxygenase small subunit